MAHYLNKLRELAAQSVTEDVIERARCSSDLEARALELVNISIDLHKMSIDLRVHAEELLKTIKSSKI